MKRFSITLFFVNPIACILIAVASLDVHAAGGEDVITRVVKAIGDVFKPKELTAPPRTPHVVFTSKIEEAYHSRDRDIYLSLFDVMVRYGFNPSELNQIRGLYLESKPFGSLTLTNALVLRDYYRAFGRPFRSESAYIQLTRAQKFEEKNLEDLLKRKFSVEFLSSFLTELKTSENYFIKVIEVTDTQRELNNFTKWAFSACDRYQPDFSRLRRELVNAIKSEIRTGGDGDYLLLQPATNVQDYFKSRVSDVLTRAEIIPLTGAPKVVQDTFKFTFDRIDVKLPGKRENRSSRSVETSEIRLVLVNACGYEIKLTVTANLKSAKAHVDMNLKNGLFTPSLNRALEKIDLAN